MYGAVCLFLPKWDGDELALLRDIEPLYGYQILFWPLEIIGSLPASSKLLRKYRILRRYGNAFDSNLITLASWAIHKSRYLSIVGGM